MAYEKVINGQRPIKIHATACYLNPTTPERLVEVLDNVSSHKGFSRKTKGRWAGEKDNGDERQRGQAIYFNRKATDRANSHAAVSR
jgi:hypothetical protein